MDIRIGDKVRFNQKGLDTPDDSRAWIGITSGRVNRAKKLGTGIVTNSTNSHRYLYIHFQDSGMPDFAWPAEMFEKKEEKLEFTQEEKELLQELIQDKLKGYQELLNKLQ